MYYDHGIDFAREQSYPTHFSNSSLLPQLLMSLAMYKHTPDTTEYFKKEYDYIVVGAGTAGSVVAARLSEDPYKTVLLLEAGKAPPLVTEVPVAWTGHAGSDIIWNFATEPQECAAWGHTNNSVRVPTGKTLGGSSTISAMIYVRGNRLEYDKWEEMGAHGWSYRDVLPYFLKAEHNTDPHIANNGFHSVHGPMTVGRFPYRSEFQGPMTCAAKSMGYRFVDINGATQSGFAYFQGNIRRGQRMSTAKAYLVPNDNRHNLDIVSGAYVTKVLINSKSKRAVGVQFDFKGSRYQVEAKSEVILSTGTIKTTQLLMLSGIGPRKTLEYFEIPVIADLPVGKGFQDHGATVYNFFTDQDRPSLPEKVRDPKNIWKYIKTRTGVLAAPSGLYGMPFLPDYKTPGHYDIPPEFAAYFVEGEWGPIPPYGISQEVYDVVFGPYLNTSTIGCVIHLLDPKSSGYVSIRSKDPYDLPIIDPKHYTVGDDVHHIVAGMKLCTKIIESPYMKKFGYRPFETVVPGCEGLHDKDEYLECFARSIMFATTHQSGTAKMGDPSDPNTVVDPYLRVKGIKGLRVVDASVMPKNPRANTLNPTVMIAEKASDMIKGYW